MSSVSRIESPAGNNGSVSIELHGFEDGPSPTRPIDLNDPIVVAAAAERATQFERDMPFWEAVKLYRWAIMWVVIFLVPIVGEGYGTVLINSLFAQESFNEKFGVCVDGKCDVPARWKSAMNIAPICGEILGLFISGILVDMWGFKKTMMGNLAFMIAAIFLPFFAGSPEVLVVSLYVDSFFQCLVTYAYLRNRVVAGIPWGAFQTIAPTYASEVLPQAIRGILATSVNICWLLGQLISQLVLAPLAHREDIWAFKIPIAIQWAFFVFVLPAVYVSPESPWYYARKGSVNAAKAALLRLASGPCLAFNPDDIIALYRHTDDMEKKTSAGSTYLDCFRGVDLRRTEVVGCSWLSQTFVGSTMMYFGTYFYIQNGIPAERAYQLGCGQYVVGILASLCAMWLMNRFGRRTIYLSGGCALFVLLMIIGFTGLSTGIAGHWATSSMLLLYTFVYNVTIGPVCYSIISEIPSSRLKSKTIVLARMQYNLGSIIVNIVTAYQLTAKPEGWNWGAFTGFFYAGLCALAVVWMYFRLPESRWRGYAELDLLFGKKISARHFAAAKVDLVAETVTLKSNETSP
ncbi:hypothetical protein QTJ16_000834 [Diplocarpon rosae]|uniref:Major facilitator superfamily (MFS) profile domain-containing protein n=1 Tax=Diplocarpon rosae TaxID=946125 RepID=A0AAD9T747_9HELO|nr:hypothetical protein QTJ16_000834 [Diplocarpon rosae]